MLEFKTYIWVDDEKFGPRVYNALFMNPNIGRQFVEEEYLEYIAIELGEKVKYLDAKGITFKIENGRPHPNDNENIRDLTQEEKESIRKM